MIKANTKYTAKEILSEAGFNPEVLGTCRVQIGGLVANKPDYIVRIVEIGTLPVVVGVETKNIEVTERAEEQTLSPDAQKVNETEHK